MNENRAIHCRQSTKLSADVTASPSSTPSEMANVDSSLQLNIVREKLNSFQDVVLSDVKKQTSRLMDDVIRQFQQHQIQTQEFRNFTAASQSMQNSNNWVNRTNNESNTSASNPTINNTTAQTTISTNDTDTVNKTENQSQQLNQLVNDVGNQRHDGSVNRSKRFLPDKVFILRDSYLTALLQVDHIKSIYHVFCVIFLIFVLHAITHDYFIKGSVQLGLETCKLGFGQFHAAFLFWLGQQIFVLSLWPALKLWAQVRRTLLKSRDWIQSLWRFICLSLYITSQVGFLVLPGWLCLKLDLPMATGLALQMETIRLLMKMHAFLRTNAPVLRQHPEEKLRMPPIRNYVYFLFAPTLIYRDSYPRNTYIRWKFVMARFSEVIAIILLHAYIYERYIKNVFSDFGRHRWDTSVLLMKIISILMPFDLLFLAGFYLILHSWPNFTGELLKFGDRMFYKDWWTASNYEVYFRNWNVLVHDWLYEYLYKDFYRHVFKGNKLASSLAVFTISALFHEIGINFTLQLFFPATYIFFGIFGVILVFVTRFAPKTFGNIFLWITLIFGYGMLLSLYIMEYYGKSNCPKTINKWYNYLVPHIWYCYQKNHASVIG